MVSLGSSQDAVVVTGGSTMMVVDCTLLLGLVGVLMLAFMAVAGFAQGATPAGAPASVVDGHFFF